EATLDSNEEDDNSDSEESQYSGLSEDESSGEDDSEDEILEWESDDDEEEEEEEEEEDGVMQDIEVNGLESKSNEIDSSDEEDIRNTIGNVPLEWYKEFDHIGYDLMGKKIGKPAKSDELDKFLDRMDNPDYWRTVEDRKTGQKVVLSDKDAEAIKRFRNGQYTDPSYDPYAPWVEFFTNEVMEHPVKATPPHKRSFIPSLTEKKKVSQYVHAMKMGWMKPMKPLPSEEEEQDPRPSYYQLWTSDSDFTRRFKHHIPAPKLKLPGHAESYNPPAEYLLTEEEELAWKDQEPEDRRRNFIPQKFSSLRLVPAFKRFVNERFERCLDLYLCPRQRKMRMNVNPEDLIPKLPKPRELQPFPTVQSLVYRGHSAVVRCLTASLDGQWMASGSDDGTVKVWEVSTARCMKTFTLGHAVKRIAWNPNSSVCLLAVAVEKQVLLLNPGLGDRLIISHTDSLLQSALNSRQDPDESETGKKIPADWHECSAEEKANGLRIKISHAKNVTHVSWHSKGDYFVSLMPEGQSQSVFIHQLSRIRSQIPFSKSKGLVQSVLFHPTRPFLFVATQRYIRVYNLLKQELSKKLTSSCKWISSMAIHPGGDNLIIGSYDCRLSWFDLDLSTKPYQTLRHQKKAIRNVCFHRSYPLFASCSDDASVVVCHGRVYNDLLQNPLIVPVKVLRGHEETKGQLGVTDCHFHPTQPWIFSAGADHTVRLFT
ncbi:hypothetical protein CAPTEDRAFT_130363, partial [Capitella teleta]